MGGQWLTACDKGLRLEEQGHSGLAGQSSVRQPLGAPVDLTWAPQPALELPLLRRGTRGLGVPRLVTAGHSCPC